MCSRMNFIQNTLLRTINTHQCEEDDQIMEIPTPDNADEIIHDNEIFYVEDEDEDEEDEEDCDDAGLI